MKPNAAVNAITTHLEHEPVPDDQSVRGAPTTAATEIGEFGGREVGIWEMSAGVMTDVEADELFIVLTGAGTVEFEDGSPTLELRPGSVVRLREGSKTTWTVTEPLRKVYVV